MTSAALIAAATAVAAAALLVNVALLTHATPRRDPVGRLSPSSALVHPATPSHVPPRTIGELPDD
jgi:hypothetical protein